MILRLNTLILIEEIVNGSIAGNDILPETGDIRFESTDVCFKGGLWL
jgi:hypothetical protein